MRRKYLMTLDELDENGRLCHGIEVRNYYSMSVTFLMFFMMFLRSIFQWGRRAPCPCGNCASGITDAGDVAHAEVEHPEDHADTKKVKQLWN